MSGGVAGWQLCEGCGATAVGFRGRASSDPLQRSGSDQRVSGFRNSTGEKYLGGMG